MRSSPRPLAENLTNPYSVNDLALGYPGFEWESADWMKPVASNASQSEVISATKATQCYDTKDKLRVIRL